MIHTPELDSILSAARLTGTVTDTTLLDRGNRKQTTVVRFADADPVVVQQSSDAETIRTEARLLDAIAERTSIPVARPLATGGEDGGWLVTPLVRGVDLHDQFTTLAPDDRTRLVAQFGNALAQLHDAFDFDAYGPLFAADETLQTGRSGTDPIAGGLELVTNGGDPPQPTADWGQWLATVGEAAIARLPAAFDDLKPQLRTVVSQPSLDAAPTPRLFPWDFRPGNALVDGTELTAILDWEGPLAADPALSYAKAEYLVADWYVPEQARQLRAAFHRGYTSVREPPTVDTAHRVAAITSTAVDSRGQVTNPRYPPVDRAEAIDFHRNALERVLSVEPSR